MRSPPAPLAVPYTSRSGRLNHRYQSPRSVRSSTNHGLLPRKWRTIKVGFLCCGAWLLVFVTVSPSLLWQQRPGPLPSAQVGLTNLMHTSKEVRRRGRVGMHPRRATNNTATTTMTRAQDREVGNSGNQFLRQSPPKHPEDGKIVKTRGKLDDASKANKGTFPKDKKGEKDNAKHKRSENKRDKQQHISGMGQEQQSLLARGVSGLPMSRTPALIGAKRGHIECDVDVDDLAYWNDPQGTRDLEFVSPFAAAAAAAGAHTTTATRYLTFEPDCGGWNNVRMSMEIIFVLAAATGRTLVLPPSQPYYLLGHGEQGARSVAHFYPMEQIKKRIPIISMADFVVEQGREVLGLEHNEIQELRPVAEKCLHQPNVTLSCDRVWSVLRKVGMQPQMEATKNCMIFDESVFLFQRNVSSETEQRVRRFCGEERKAIYYTQELHGPELIHWNAYDLGNRLFGHFYATLYFTNPAVDNYFKRFVRDFLRYKDEIFCAAGKVIHSLQKEGLVSTLHIRRGDLQYQEVKISGQELYNNTKEVWRKGETLYIATDERNKTLFDPIKEHHPVKFLDDYWDLAKLGDVDSGYLGMIDTIVAASGRTFTGTWFSTFSAYINRLRGYEGYSMNDSWYSYLPRKTRMHGWEYPNHMALNAREWPIGWVGIDGDEVLEEEQTPVRNS